MDLICRYTEFASWEGLHFFCREKKLKSYPIYKLKQHSGNSSSSNNNSGKSISKIYMRTNNSYSSGNNSTRLVFDIKSILKSCQNFSEIISKHLFGDLRSKIDCTKNKNNEVFRTIFFFRKHYEKS